MLCYLLDFYSCFNFNNMIKHEHDNNGPTLIHDGVTFFRSITPKSDQYYRIKNGSIEQTFGLNKVYTFEEVVDELELSNGKGLTCTCTCSICGASADMIALKQSFFEN